MNTNDGWSEVGRLVLNELERLNNNYENLKKGNDEFINTISHVKITQELMKKDIDELEKWQKAVNEIWPIKQMEESKKQIDIQRTKWIYVTAVISVINFMLAIIAFLK